MLEKIIRDKQKSSPVLQAHKELHKEQPPDRKPSSVAVSP